MLIQREVLTPTLRPAVVTSHGRPQAINASSLTNNKKSLTARELLALPASS